MPKLLDLKICGAANAASPTNVLATQSVEFWSDGSWQFTISGHRYIYTGNDADINKLLTAISPGASGLNGAVMVGNKPS